MPPAFTVHMGFFSILRPMTAAAVFHIPFRPPNAPPATVKERAVPYAAPANAGGPFFPLLLRHRPLPASSSARRRRTYPQARTAFSTSGAERAAVQPSSSRDNATGPLRFPPACGTEAGALTEASLLRFAERPSRRRQKPTAPGVAPTASAISASDFPAPCKARACSASQLLRLMLHAPFFGFCPAVSSRTAPPSPPGQGRRPPGQTSPGR